MGVIITFLCISTTQVDACQKSLEAFFIITGVTKTQREMEAYVSKKILKKIDKTIILIGTPIYTIGIKNEISTTFPLIGISDSVTIGLNRYGGMITFNWGF